MNPVVVRNVAIGDESLKFVYLSLEKQEKKS